MKATTTLAHICALICLAPLLAQAQNTFNVSGTLRSRLENRQSATEGPLAAANALQPGIVPFQTDYSTAELEFRASGPHWSLIGTGDSTRGSGLVNEAAFNADVAGWQWTVGKKIVGWDVGYAFRPNDVVQQEVRRTLVSTLPEGRPLLMADHISGDSAWTLVAVNPTADKNSTGGQEPALAARYYLRNGNADWHVFARAADRSGNSAGAAVAWVPSDSTELHASARVMERAENMALMGGTWTNESQVSVLAEAWWDGTAWSPDQWAQWRQRNGSLPSLTGRGVPAAAVAGSLAGQAEAFVVSNSLHQRNVFVRVSWDHEAWQPSLDVLLHPDDGGHMITAALLWKGDRIKVQAGMRLNAGPADAVLAQLPARRQSYLVLSWAF